MKYNCRAFRTNTENWDDPNKFERINFIIESKTLTEAKTKAGQEAQMLDMQSTNKIVQKIEMEVDGEWQSITWI